MEEAAKVSPEQQRLLDIMLDPQRPPQERALAGDALAEIGDPRPGVGLDANGLPLFDWITIPAGEFVMGSNPAKSPKGSHYAIPEQRATIAQPYRISRYLVTYAQYKAFLEAKDGYADTQWWDGLHADALKAENRPGDQQFRKIANRPAELVCWFEAMAFCTWLTAKLGYEVRLPTEEEWERAARGTDGRIFPWGNKYLIGYANIDEKAFSRNKASRHHLQQTTAVGIYPQGASPDGLLDMCGNMSTWTLTEYDSGSSTDVSSGQRRVVRGSWNGAFVTHARAAYRDQCLPRYRFPFYGFRVAAVS